MQFTTLALSALSISGALAKISNSTSSSSTSAAVKASSTGTSSGTMTVHVIKVGNANGTLAYFPNNVKANVGDMVQFQFAPNNHTVTQSSFDQPCQPLAMNSNTTGFYSGFMPVAASSTTTPTYTIMINNTMPMWIYCSQAKHCQSGMTMVINENTAANATRSLANFQALAAKSTVNLPGNAVSGASSGASSSSTSSSSGTTNSGSSSGSSSSMMTSAASATSTSTANSGGTMSTNTTAGTAAKASSPAMAVRAGASDALGLTGLLGLAFALFL